MATPLFDSLMRSLAPSYADVRERRQVVCRILEDALGLHGAAVYVREDSEISLSDRKRLEEIVGRLLQDEPLQYVLGVTEFCGRTFLVGPGALIPRPETEDLVTTCTDLIRHIQAENPCKSVRLIDAGTGTGCIALSVALEVPEVRAVGFDVSPEALALAEKNRAILSKSVHFYPFDMLRLLDVTLPLPDFLIPQDDEISLWVSNPPYIHPEEARDMEKRVLDHEPNLALFAPEAEPVLFYRAVAQGAKRSGARIAVCEINPLFAPQTREAFLHAGFADVVTKADRYGIERILLAKK